MENSKVSCLLCRKRKVKCDRTLPRCLKCLKKHQLCQFPGIFRSQTLVHHQVEDIRKRNSHHAYFYGHNSSNFLEKLSSRNLDDREDPSRQKLFALPQLVDDADRNLKILRVMIEQLKNSKMSELYRDFLDFDIICTLLASLVPCETSLTIYGMVLVANRYVQILSENQLSSLSHLMTNMIDECPLKPLKISSMLLLIEFHYSRFEINSAYRLLFLATSDAYALGIHKSDSPLWVSLAFYDTVICSSVGRPTSLTNLLFSVRSLELERVVSVVEIIWRCNNEAQKSPLNYKTIIELDCDCDKGVELISSGGIFSSHLSVILLANQAKIHLSFLQNEYSVYKIQKLLEKILHEMGKIIQFLKEEGKLNNGRTILSEFKSQFPFAWCFGYQSLLILLVFLTKKQLYTERMCSEAYNLADIVKEKIDEELDPLFVNVLSAVKSCILDLKDKNGQGEANRMPDIDFTNPHFFHEVDFWSSLASIEQSSWESSSS